MTAVINGSVEYSPPTFDYLSLLVTIAVLGTILGVLTLIGSFVVCFWCCRLHTLPVFRGRPQERTTVETGFPPQRERIEMMNLYGIRSGVYNDDALNRNENDLRCPADLEFQRTNGECQLPLLPAPRSPSPSPPFCPQTRGPCTKNCCSSVEIQKNQCLKTKNSFKSDTFISPPHLLVPHNSPISFGNWYASENASDCNYPNGTAPCNSSKQVSFSDRDIQLPMGSRFLKSQPVLVSSKHSLSPKKNSVGASAFDTYSHSDYHSESKSLCESKQSTSKSTGSSVQSPADLRFSNSQSIPLKEPGYDHFAGAKQKLGSSGTSNNRDDNNVNSESGKYLLLSRHNDRIIDDIPEEDEELDVDTEKYLQDEVREINLERVYSLSRTPKVTWQRTTLSQPRGNINNYYHPVGPLSNPFGKEGFCTPTCFSSPKNPRKSTDSEHKSTQTESNASRSFLREEDLGLDSTPSLSWDPLTTDNPYS